jgi:hypothetical protein
MTCFHEPYFERDVGLKMVNLSSPGLSNLQHGKCIHYATYRGFILKMQTRITDKMNFGTCVSFHQLNKDSNNE